MRASLPATLLLSALLAACSTKGDIPPSKHIAQSGALRVHPGLLGKPVPPNCNRWPRVAAVPAAAAGEEAIKMDPVGLRTQRSVYFDLNSADIKGDYDPALRAHARYLADHPNARAHRRQCRRTRQRRIQPPPWPQACRKRPCLAGRPGRWRQTGEDQSLGEARPKVVGTTKPRGPENRRADVVSEVEN